MEDVLAKAWAQIKWEEDQYSHHRSSPSRHTRRDSRVDRRTTEAVEALKGLGDKVKWPEKLRTPADQGDKSKWCNFYADLGHRTKYCIALKLKVSHLLKQGHLTDLLTDKGRQTLQQGQDRQQSNTDVTPPRPPQPDRKVNVITGGSEVSGITHSAARRHTRQAGHLQAEHGKAERNATIQPAQTISFTTSESTREMGIDETKIIRKMTVLVGFSGEQKTTLGEIELPVYAEGVNLCTRFLVVDSPSAYNVILGRPWIHEMGAVPSTYHQVLRLNVDPDYPPRKQK
ncbi:uncharacterized protein LOC130990749 [Salvia miltiorrhiza]|uniref:uncharacterized protein LOC130990749 n=1 Tax=Salvia miltiorrhiza TaxID=226208 RepID=UPI0025ABB77E|nr:uncharacterized protein LOC130990749 [Salvia miltiorrhiza]